MSTEPPWNLVLPVKGGVDAKTRLGLGADGPRLALAMALDCVSAVLATPTVRQALVVTADADTADAVRALGGLVVPDPGGGLAGAVAAGLRAAPDGPTGVLLADLPCLTPSALDAGLDAVTCVLRTGAGSVVVPDCDGHGTVLLAAGGPRELRPAFGGASAAAHERYGATRLDLDLPRLRRDVDTPQDLRAAVRIGIGPRTAATLGIVQTTVLTFDPATRSGTVVTDDGIELDLAPDALAGSGLRHLRPGQRVTCDPAPGRADAVTSVRIVGVSG